MQPTSAPVAKRPGGITILGILAILIGIFGTIGGVVLLSTADPVILALSAVAVLIGILYLATGIGFFRGDKWARILGITVSVLSFARNLVEGALGGIVYAAPGIILAVFILYYLNKPEVKAWFVRSK